MYSMVLMMAMSASPEATAFGGCKGYSCSGYSCSGCYSNSCHGGGLFGGHKSCQGCTGYSCTGYSCTGCTGYTSCCGCKGGFFGGGLFRGHKGNSCCGCSGYSSCYGCSGYSCSGYSGCTGVVPGTVVPAAPKAEPVPAPKKGGVTSAPATIVVNVPADATITIDGTATKSTSAVRVFATPELAPGAVYYYTVKAEVVREGKTLVATEKVAVEAGANSVITLTPAQTPVVASK